MKKTATIFLSFLSVLVYSKNINNKTFIRDSRQSLHYIESRVNDSVDVANIRADELIADRYFDLTFEKALTSFDYVNSRGTANLQFIDGQTNFIELNYSFKVLRSLYLKTGINLMEFDTTSQDNENRNFYSWTTSYAGIGTGLSLRVLSLNKIYIMLDSKIGFLTLLGGEQKINLQTLSLNDQQEFEGQNSFYSFGISISYKVSDSIAIGIKSSQYVTRENILESFPRAFVQNLSLKSRNIGLSLYISN